jgi:simple sugar transport system permease protein
MAGGGPTQSPALPELPTVSVPLVEKLAGLEDKHWFFLSDLAGVLRGTLSEVSVFTVHAIVLVPLSY